MAPGVTPAFDDDEELDGLVSRADLDALVRTIDVRCEHRDWAGLLRLRDRARAAVSTGRQLWPAATLAEFRLGLLAPPEWAAAVLAEDAGRFTIGPLTEVVAQHLTFAELAPHLEAGPRASLVAHERVIRGEFVDPTDLLLAASPNPTELPYRLQAWEPQYPVATYSDAGIEQPTPVPIERSRLVPVRPAAMGARVVDEPVERVSNDIHAM